VVQDFASRFAEARSHWGPLSVGLDPSGSLLEDWELGDTPDGLDRFADIVLEATVGAVGLVKPQSAFYERHGWRGLRTLQRLITGARQYGLLVIVDAKRGDIGNTNTAYAEAFLGHDAPFGADALTVHPYLGVDALEPFVALAYNSASCLFIVTRSTNPDGRLIQSARTSSGATVEERLLLEIGSLNSKFAPDRIGPVGAVVGPNITDSLLDLTAAHALFLAPGIGSQGATPADVARAFAACPDRVIPSASRSILSAGPDKQALRGAIQALADELTSKLAT
jgi:orotidine-5'-phosphate decarboxylase